jgi:hydrogenase maturation factor HypF (carbamoyltransferase family)
VPDALTERLRVTVRGAVQGVGFRPFVFRLATELGLAGWVKNSAQGVFIEVEGPRVRLEQFLVRLERDRPPRSSIQSLEPMWLDPVGYRGFRIEPSAHFGPKTALVLPDIATCAECVREIFDPARAPLSLSFHQLHPLRPALHHHRSACPTTGRQHLDEALPSCASAMPG